MKPTNGKSKAQPMPLLYCLLGCVVLYVMLALWIGNEPQHVMTEGYFVNTTGCRMMALSAQPSGIGSHLEQLKQTRCKRQGLFSAEQRQGRNYLKLTEQETQLLSYWNLQSIDEIHCRYRRVIRVDDFRHRYAHGGAFRLRHGQVWFELQIGALMLRIQCFNGYNKSIYHDVHFFLPAPKPKAQSKPKRKRLSVMILGIDSLSHMHFVRSMPQTAAYIKQLSHVEFWGYNRLGSNSFPNLMPLLMGQSYEEVERGCYANKSSFDHCPLLWQQFKAAGYSTSFGEDNVAIGTFTYLRKGFQRQPTDFYLNPVMAEIHNHTGYQVTQLQKLHGRHKHLDLLHECFYHFQCTGSRSYAAVLHEFVQQLLPHLQSEPHFAFLWATEGVHNYFNYAQLLDERYARLLRQLSSQRILQRTLLLLMADHGIRYGSFRTTYQGMLEENQPLLIALYPSWLDAAFPLAMSHLRSNARSLVTSFDLHETLRHLIEPEQLQDSQIRARVAAALSKPPPPPRGISLFLPIPDERDCQSAGIPSQFCLCHKLSSISTNDERAQRAAQFVVGSINKLLLNYPLCHSLGLHQLLAAYLIDSASNPLEFEVKVSLSTLPGLGRFEGTTRFLNHQLALNGLILRTNKYGNQSFCLRDYHIEMYCYCK